MGDVVEGDLGARVIVVPTLASLAQIVTGGRTCLVLVEGGLHLRWRLGIPRTILVVDVLGPCHGWL